jgi:hypothetical protein
LRENHVLAASLASSSPPLSPFPTPAISSFCTRFLKVKNLERATWTFLRDKTPRHIFAVLRTRMFWCL